MEPSAASTPNARPVAPLDHELAKLRRAFPGWDIWYVPKLHGATWCARRLPLLKENTAGALAAAMAAAEGRETRDMIGVLSPTVVPPAGHDRLHILDRLRAELLAALPGWHVVYRPHADGAVEWEAYRLPLLNADSAEALARDMLEVDERYSTGPYEPDEPAVTPRPRWGPAPIGGL